MTTIEHAAPSLGFSGWLLRTEAWLDDKGKAAWIVTLVLAFIIFWPVGLALLAYMIWSNKMSCTSSRRTCGRSRQSSPSTGNAAFDAYKEDTLKRLQDEQQTFEAFLQRLRQARDKSEFDQFMHDRTKSEATSDQAEA